MSAKELVTKVWIEPGCIVCDACETSSPEVFEVQDDTCIIRPEALAGGFTKPRTDSIIDAAEECPVDVIKFETVTAEVSDSQAAAAPAQSSETPAADTAPRETASAESTTSKSPEKPAPKPQPEPTAPSKRAAAHAAKTSMAGEPDPAIAALLRAATSRGGNVGILRHEREIPEAVQRLQKKDPRELPPDARQAMILEATKKVKQDPDRGRRAVAGGAALTLGWVAFGSGLGVAVGPAFARFMMPNVLEEPDPHVRVGKFDRYSEMAPGDVNEDYKPEGIWMIRDGDHIAALSTICTHLGCIPNWLPNDHKFKCPCHGSGYLPNGINFEGPTPRPLERFRLSIEDGIVVVDKSKTYRYELGQWTQPGSYLGV